MHREEADVAIVGAGFAGSLMALILRRLSHRVMLLEKGRHPRFAIGESSTPLANLALAEISQRYELPRLMPLTKWGLWQQQYPHLACGLKRGFSYFGHEAHQTFKPSRDHTNELLVASNPSVAEADTHWFREHFDAFMLQEAVDAGVLYFDETTIATTKRARHWEITATRHDQSIVMQADFVLDATGPGGFLAQLFGIDTQPTDLRTNAWTVYSHFRNLRSWHNILAELGGKVGDHPFPCDDAALHHVFADGWMWVLPFNNGITSAGFALNGERYRWHEGWTAEEEWHGLLVRYPSIGEQFRDAELVRPFTKTGRLQRHAKNIAGPGWALLPHAAYFLDPFFSPGNAHTLTGLLRLARLFEQHWRRPSFDEELAKYAAILHREIQFVDWLIAGCYETFGRFDAFASYALFYFAAAIQSEHLRRRGDDAEPYEFLFSHDERLRHGLEEAYGMAKGGVSSETLRAHVLHAIEPFNGIGLGKPDLRNTYPYS